MGTLYELIGDATKPVGDAREKKTIVHCCNDIGAWGSGFVIALRKRWPHVESAYRMWFHDKTWEDGVEFKLGRFQVVHAEPGINVVNLIAQRGLRNKDNPVPLRYDFLREGLHDLAMSPWADETDTFHMPLIGCGRAGGDWAVVSAIVRGTLCDAGFDVYVYKWGE